MQQSKASSVKLLRKILIDLKENVWNYANEYTYIEDEQKVIYSANVEKLKNMAEQAILDKEYLKALTYYTTANQYIDKQEYRFDTQIIFLNRILDYIKKNQKNIESMLKIRKDRALEIHDEKNYLLLKKYEIKLINPSITDLCRTVNNLIENHYYVAATKILDIIKYKDQIKKYSHVINYLNAKNMEFSMVEYENSTSKQVNEKLIRKIRIYLEKEQYDLAYKIAYNGICSTNNPIFYYYLGKICYKDKKIEQALEYFNTYKMLGVEKYSKTQLYLYYIYLKQDYEKTAAQQVKDVLEIKSILGKSILGADLFDEFEYFKPGYGRRNHSSNYRSDPKPNKCLIKIKMSEEDFLKRD